MSKRINKQIGISRNNIVGPAGQSPFDPRTTAEVAETRSMENRTDKRGVRALRHRNVSERE